MEREREWVEEVTRFALESRVNGTLDIDLGLSKDFCSRLLRRDDESSGESISPAFHGEEDLSVGVPRYPLYERLAAALYQSIVSGNLRWPRGEEWFLKLKQEECGSLLRVDGFDLLNILRSVNSEVRVQETSFSLLKGGLKTIEVVCTNADTCCQCSMSLWYFVVVRIEPGDVLLINKTLALEAETVHKHASLLATSEVECPERVLPGVRCIEDGANMYREFYWEKEELPSGGLAISVMKLVAQPYLSLARILSGLSYEGVQFLLGLGHTVGTVVDALPPPRSILLSSFTQQHNPNVKGSTLTSGARALAKHSERSSNKFWGISSGNDFEKNRYALDFVGNLIASCHWSNLHIVPQHGVVFEIRIAKGYGARWSKDGKQFIGFLEPYMADGHTKGWKH